MFETFLNVKNIFETVLKRPKHIQNDSDVPKHV